MTPKEDAELLMNEGIKFAEKMLAEHGEFFPFGIALRPDGEIVHVGASNGTEHPKSKRLVDILLDGFREAAAKGEYVAVGLLFDVRIPRPEDHLKVDAVQVALEHRAGYCADVFFPYVLADRGVQFGNIFAQRRNPAVFPTDRGVAQPN